MILESGHITSRIFGPDRKQFALKLDSGHGFDVPTATPGAAVTRLLLRLTKYGHQRNIAVTKD